MSRGSFDDKSRACPNALKESSESSPTLPIIPFSEIPIHDRDLKEKFIKGSGPGGQKVNKCVSAVWLKHIPTGIIIETQRFRDLQSNRKEARKLLRFKLDEMINKKASKKAVKIAKIQRQKAKQRQRCRKDAFKAQSHPEEPHQGK